MPDNEENDAASSAIQSPPPMVIFDEQQQDPRLLSRRTPFGLNFDVDEKVSDGLGMVTIAEAVSEAVVEELCQVGLQLAHASSATPFDARRLEFILDENERIVDYGFVKEDDRSNLLDDKDGVTQSFSSSGNTSSIRRSSDGVNLTDSESSGDRKLREDYIHYFDEEFKNEDYNSDVGSVVDAIENFARSISGLSYLSDFGVEDAADKDLFDIEEKVIEEYGIDYVKKYEEKMGDLDGPISSTVGSYEHKSPEDDASAFYPGDSLTKERSFQTANSTATTAEILHDIIHAERKEQDKAAWRSWNERSLRQLIHAEHERHKAAYNAAYDAAKERASLNEPSLTQSLDSEGKELTYEETRKRSFRRYIGRSIARSLESMRNVTLSRSIKQTTKIGSNAETNTQKSDNSPLTADSTLSNRVQTKTQKTDDVLATRAAAVPLAANLILDDDEKSGENHSVDKRGAAAVKKNRSNGGSVRSLNRSHLTFEKTRSNNLVDQAGAISVTKNRSNASSVRSLNRSHLTFEKTRSNNLDDQAGATSVIKNRSNASSVRSLRSSGHRTSEKMRSSYSYADTDTAIIVQNQSGYSYADTDTTSIDNGYPQHQEKITVMADNATPHTEYSEDRETKIYSDIVDPGIDEELNDHKECIPVVQTDVPKKGRNGNMDETFARKDGIQLERVQSETYILQQNLEVIHHPNGLLIPRSNVYSSHQNGKPMDSLSDHYDNEEVEYDPTAFGESSTNAPFNNSEASMSNHTGRSERSSCCDLRSVTSSLHSRSHQGRLRTPRYVVSESDFSSAPPRSCLSKIIDDTGYDHMSEGIETQLSGNEMKTPTPSRRLSIERAIDNYSTMKSTHRNNCCDPRSITASLQTRNDDLSDAAVRRCLWKILENAESELSTDPERGNCEGVEAELNVDSVKIAKTKKIRNERIRALSRSMKRRLLDPEKLFCGLKPVPKQGIKNGHPAKQTKKAQKEFKESRLKTERSLHQRTSKSKTELDHFGKEGANDFHMDKDLWKEDANNTSMETATTAATEDEGEISHLEIEVTDISTIASNDRLFSSLSQSSSTPPRKNNLLSDIIDVNENHSSRENGVKDDSEIDLLKVTKISVTTDFGETSSDNLRRDIEEVKPNGTNSCPVQTLSEDKPNTTPEPLESPTSELQERKSQHNGELEDLLRKISSYVDGIVENSTHSMLRTLSPDMIRGVRNEEVLDDKNSNTKRSSSPHMEKSAVEKKDDTKASQEGMIDTIYVPTHKIPEKAKYSGESPKNYSKSVKTIDLMSMFDGSLEYSESSHSNHVQGSLTPNRSLMDDDPSESSSALLGSSVEPDPRPPASNDRSQFPQDEYQTLWEGENPVVYHMKSSPPHTKRMQRNTLKRNAERYSASLKTGILGRSTMVRAAKFSDDDDDIELTENFPYQAIPRAKKQESLEEKMSNTPEPSRRNFLSDTDNEGTRKPPVFDEGINHPGTPPPSPIQEDTPSYREKCRPPTPPRKVKFNLSCEQDSSITTEATSIDATNDAESKKTKDDTYVVDNIGFLTASSTINGNNIGHNQKITNNELIVDENGFLTEASSTSSNRNDNDTNSNVKSKELVVDENGFLIEKNAAFLEDRSSRTDAATFNPYESKSIFP